MKINTVDLPKMTIYYIAENHIDDTVNKLSTVNNVEIKDNHLHLYMPNDNELSENLRLILSKSGRLTAGDMHIYEYELDISIPDGNKFKFEIDGIEYICTIFSISNLENSDLHLVFKIVNK